MRPPYASILCPSDLSPAADRALAVAYALAGTDTVVHLLHVNEPDVAAVAVDGSRGRPRPAVETARATTEKRVHAHLRRLVPAESVARGIRTEVRVLHGSNVAEEILAEAERSKADVIVMGTHGRTGLGRILMGPVAMDVLRAEAAPVILVRDRGPA